VTANPIQGLNSHKPYPSIIRPPNTKKSLISNNDIRDFQESMDFSGAVTHLTFKKE
jgi:hypothetical protein